MTYEELSEHLIFFDKASKDYEKYSRGNSEYDQECAGSISGDLHETHEILMYGISDSKEHFEIVNKAISFLCPNTFEIMIANLDSDPNKYETLYDLCKDIDIKKEDNWIFPKDCLKKIKIYK